MRAVKKVEQVESAGSSEDLNTHAATQPKSRSGAVQPNLSRCAACYNHKASSMLRWGGDAESSSEYEDSGPEDEPESEAESSSSSSCSEKVSSEPGGREESQEDHSRAKQDLRSLPTPHLTPQHLLPRPHTVVSTLHLEVLSQNNEDVAKQQESTWGGHGGGREGINDVTPPQVFPWQQMGLPWQTTQLLSYQQQQQPHQLLHQHQQQQHFPPLSAQGQRLPPPLHTPPVPHPLTLYSPLHTPPVPHPLTLYSPLQALNAPQTYLHAPAAQPHSYISSRNFPYMYETH
ncbi:splicing factor 3B subunit 4-like [Cottoperca gobio]|uniref:Splicing factor 3B subunit 4-like n=1 Tax=Cottoperca gobio TaxID=56716 RepID=A0A6J2R7T2_COTGO|nr:splicing factor 3B subunit 4-like [Cottoperca gobio]